MAAAAKPRIGFTEPPKEEEPQENWQADPLRWHPALGILELPALPPVGARIGTDGNIEVLKVQLGPSVVNCLVFR